jgi:hypothetical protein
MALNVSEDWLRAYCKRTGQKLPAEIGEERGRVQKERRSKYGNLKTSLDGRVFASKHEAEAYQRFALEVMSGEHYAVLCQVPFNLPGGVKYIADFVTLELDKTFTVWDAKSEATARDKAYRIKKRQMKECLGIEIREV